MMNFSIDILVSILKTNFLYPNSSVFAIPNPNVTSGICFFPFLTTTKRSASKSNANPISFLLVTEINSDNSSDVGSGPLEHPESSSFSTLTLHPIFFNKSGANPFAAPPPISTTTSG